MPPISGRKGRLYVGLASSTAVAEPVAFLKKWSLDQSTDTYDVTAFGDENKNYVAGLPDATGDYEGFYDTVTAQTYTAGLDGAARRVYLYPDNSTGAADYFFGTAIFDWSIDVPVDGPVAISGSFKAASRIAAGP